MRRDTYAAMDSKAGSGRKSMDIGRGCRLTVIDDKDIEGGASSLMKASASGHIFGNKNAFIYMMDGRAVIIELPEGAEYAGDGSMLKECGFCGALFITKKGNAMYCDRCRKDDARVKAYERKLSETPGHSDYRKAYKTMHARHRTGLITTDEYDAWRIEGAAKREQFRNGEISLGSFLSWISGSTQLATLNGEDRPRARRRKS